MNRVSGLSALELIIAMALFAVVAVKAVLVMNSANEAYGNDSAIMSLEDQARKTLDQISYAVLGSDRETIFPVPASPIYSPYFRYSLNLGIDADGNIVYDDPEEIALSEDETQVLWKKNPGTPEEQRVAWSNNVRQFLEGELLNAIDDNENGVIDETGLAFTVHKDAVTIRLSLERTTSDGETITHSEEAEITIRN